MYASLDRYPSKQVFPVQDSKRQKVMASDKALFLAGSAYLDFWLGKEEDVTKTELKRYKG